MGKLKTTAAVLVARSPCVPPGWAVGRFAGSNEAADMPAKYLAGAKGASRLGGAVPDSQGPLCDWPGRTV
eukprot:4616602-Pyramimonas_sp.AAC.1